MLSPSSVIICVLQALRPQAAQQGTRWAQVEAREWRSEMSKTRFPLNTRARISQVSATPGLTVSKGLLWMIHCLCKVLTSWRKPRAEERALDGESGSPSFSHSSVSTGCLTSRECRAWTSVSLCRVGIYEGLRLYLCR